MSPSENEEVQRLRSLLSEARKEISEKDATIAVMERGLKVLRLELESATLKLAASSLGGTVLDSRKASA